MCRARAFGACAAGREKMIRTRAEASYSFLTISLSATSIDVSELGASYPRMAHCPLISKASIAVANFGLRLVLQS